jgi:signal peptide peptidase SppA
VDETISLPISRAQICDWLLLMDPQRIPQYADALREVSAGPAAEAQKARLPIQMSGSTAVVSLTGLTNKRFHMEGFLASYMAVTAAVRAAAVDKGVANILLRVDSPGGYVSGIADVADAIYEARQSKPVVAQVDGLAASAGYWLASQAQQVYAGRLDEVGSIGVLAVIYDVSGAMKAAGIKAEVFATGKFKWAGVPGTSLSTEQRTYIQETVDRTGDAFVADVARGRDMSVADVTKLADGRVFPASEAVRNRLVDGVQSFEATLARMARARDRASRLRQARLETS